MSATRLLFAQLIILIVLTNIVFYGLAHDFLWSVSWFSALAHLLGGMWAAMFAAWGMQFLGIRVRFLYCVLFAIVLGLCWEIFEVIIGATHFPASTFDTVEDIGMDIVGGVAGVFFVRYLWARG